jgi:lysophospholipase L1-like esterase
MLQSNHTLVFYGDSITHGHRRPDEVHDVYELGHGYVRNLAARWRFERPEQPLRIVNRGECGNSVRTLYHRLGFDVLDHRPDVLSILIGINDAAPEHQRWFTAEDYERDYTQLLTVARRGLPKLRLVVLEPFALPVSREGHGHPHFVVEDARMAVLPAYAAAAKRVAVRHEALFIPLQRLFDEACRRAPPIHWAYDGVHPSAAGHELISRAWWSAVVESEGTARAALG